MRKVNLRLLVLLGLLCCFTPVFSQNAWKEVSESTLKKDLFAGGRYKPDAYKIFQLNEFLLQQELIKVPLRSVVPAESSDMIITIPDSDGQPLRFRFVESSVMEPTLAAKFPEIKTYFGQGIDDPGSTIYFDFSPRGFHAMVLSSAKKTLYIDPLDSDDKYYVVFSQKDVVNYRSDFRCLTPESAQNSSLQLPSPALITGRGADDGKLRSYRLALACTGEYASYFLNGTESNDAQRKAKVLAAMTTLVVRTNAIFERDFAIHLNLVGNNDLIIYLNANTDPWGSELNIKTQETIDAVIGDPNYDIGHLVDRGSNNGNAGCIGCVCVTWNGSSSLGSFRGKGGAFTSHQTPEGDPFIVDYTSHEMGHQFGANHTFSFSPENTGTQMEPGSGSTIMGYAGITGSTTDVQANSDDYFHAISIQQITDYVKSSAGGSCATITNTNNTPPTANAGPDYTIPKETPFVLTGTASDPDPVDVLSYTWEQFNSIPDNESQLFPIPTDTVGPLFRSLRYNPSPSRTFPQLSSILNGSNGNKWERLPSVERILTFRFTVRDNHVGGGSTKDDDMLVTIAATAGPFRVTSPNSVVSWPGGTDQTITWDVANTNAAPVNCTNVKISLSYDGGQTFPVVLAESTPNDGSAIVHLPATTSTQARIKVEAVGNIFFDISNVNFNITGPDFFFDSPAPATINCTQTSSSITLGTSSNLGFNTPVVLSASNVPAGTSITFGTNPVTPGNNSVVTLNNVNALTPGSTYDVTITGVAGAIVKTQTLRFVVESQAPPTIASQPQSVSTCLNTSTTLSVTATNAVGYEWQLSTNGGSSYNPAPGANNAAAYTITNPGLNMSNYRYRVQVNGTCSQVITSSAAVLTVVAPVEVSENPSDRTVCETENLTFSANGTSSIPIQYQWQVSINGGVYINLTNGGAYSGVNTSTLTISNPTAAMNGNRYRALLSSAVCTNPATTAAATLTVHLRPTIQLTASPLTDLLPGQTTTLNAAINPAPTGFNISWTRDDQLLPGITGTSYLVDSAEVGNYKVSIVNPTTGCSNESNVQRIGATASSNLFIFPTPNDGRFTVSYYNSSGTAGRQTLAIYDTRGQMVYNAQLNVNGPYTLHDINLRGKAKGVYYIVIGDGSGKKITEGKVMIY